jgi:F-type H+-transporting ATPase subunit b
MEMDWTTFVLEVINFLVLVWLLQHFFYRPVLAVIDRRQARVQATRDEAETMRRDADGLRQQYETRLADWNAERGQARQQLEQELLQERTRRIDELKHALADEEAKSRVRGDAAAVAREAALNREAVADAYAAAAAMLQRLAAAPLTARIAQAFREDLAALSDSDRATLRQAADALAGHEAVEIVSAHPLDAAERTALSAGLSQAAGRQLEVSFREAPELIAGLRAAVGQCRLDASLADELAFFRKDAAHA